MKKQVMPGAIWSSGSRASVKARRFWKRAFNRWVRRWFKNGQ